MSRRTLHPVLTPARRRWLEALDVNAVQRRRGPIAHQCELLGWTEGVFVADDSGDHTATYLGSRQPIPGERLTALGRIILAAGQASAPQCPSGHCRHLTLQAAEAVAVLEAVPIIDPLRPSRAEVAALISANSAACAILMRASTDAPSTVRSKPPDNRF